MTGEVSMVAIDALKVAVLGAVIEGCE